MTARQECTLESRVATCTATANDPRVTGPFTMTWTWGVATPDNETVYVSEAAATLEGPAGTWTGHVYATWLPGYFMVGALGVLIGDGAYEGWAYVFSAHPYDMSVSFDSYGTVYRGSPPPPWEVPTASPAASPSPGI